MAYWQYWHLNGAPFAVGGRHQFYRGPSVDEALARLEFICGQRHELATLLGPSGVGKSCLLNYMVECPPRHAEHPIPLMHLQSMLGLSAGDLALELAKKLVGSRFRKSADAWHALSDCFVAATRSESQCVLLIDDCENCGAEAENDLIRLVRMAEGCHVSFVLAIETHLASTVSRWLLDRSYLQIELPLWDLEQAHDFLRSCMQRGGRPLSAYTDSAVERLHELSRGTPRRLVQLADLALIAGAVMKAPKIDETIIDHVAQEMPKPSTIAA